MYQPSLPYKFHPYFHLLPPYLKWTNKWCFIPRFCTCKAILIRGQPGLMRWILSWFMPVVQDQSHGLLNSSPACYHYTMDAPTPPYIRVIFKAVHIIIKQDREPQLQPPFISLLLIDNLTAGGDRGNVKYERGGGESIGGYPNVCLYICRRMS